MMGMSFARGVGVVLLTILLVHGILSTVYGVKAQQDDRSAATSSRFCQKFVVPVGYSCDEYKVQTEDGYILAMHRISNWYHKTRAPTSGSSDESREPAIFSPQAVSSWAPEQPADEYSSPQGAFDSYADMNAPTSVSSDESREPATYSLQAVSSQASEQPADEESFPQGSFSTDDTDLSMSIRKKLFQSVNGPAIIHRRKRISNQFGSKSSETEKKITQLRFDTGLSMDSVHNENFKHRSKPVHQLHKTKRNLQDANIAESPQSEESERPFELGPENSGSESPSSDDLPPEGIPYSSPSGNPAQEIPSPAPSRHEKHCHHQGACERSPVLLMHPEFLNGDNWFMHADSSTDQLLPLMLVDAGFDVWIGHHRATLWGHDHVFLHADDPVYWEWTWDEQAQYDIPALLGFINETTRDTAHYVGVSQSATAGAAAATIPSVAQLMASCTLLGPTIYRGNTNSLVLEAWAFVIGDSLDKKYYREGFQHATFNLSSEFPVSTIYTRGPFGDPMVMALNTISGPNCCLGSISIRFDNGWDGTTSFKNLIHFQQGLRSNSWQHFVYETDQLNAEAYDGNVFPPAYNPADIPATLPIFVVYGDQDQEAPPIGVKQFLSGLKCHPETLFLRNYAHFDLTYSLNRTDEIYGPILQYLIRQEEHFETYGPRL